MTTKFKIQKVTNQQSEYKMSLYELEGIPKAYSLQAQEVQRGREAKIQHLLAQRKLPAVGWSEHDVESLLRHLSDMDSNNFPANCGVGEREGRVYSNLVSRRCFGLSHGIGRSGDLREPQPKAAGSSILAKLTNSLALDLIRAAGVRSAKDAFVAPVATGMGVALCLMALKRQRPGSKYVIWSRVDQKSCFKAILTAGLEPVIMSLVKAGDELRTDTHSIEDVVNLHGGADSICAIVTATSVFAPRVADDVPAVAEICHNLGIPHVVNNAYGVQSSKCMHILEESGKREKNRRVDAFVQSTDKNLMVPVGGSIIAGFDTDFVRKVAQNYPGRASSSPTIDVFITLMQMGTAGYKALMDERRENYKLLKEEMTKVAEKYGERVLETRNNPISIAMTLSSIGDPDDPKGRSISEIGSMLFTRGVSGTRVITGRDTKVIEGYTFKAWGSHWDKTDMPYLTAAAAIGMTHEDIMTFIRRLDKVMAARSKNNSKALHQVQTPSKTPTSNNVPTISVESNGSPGPKKLTYV